MSGVIKAFDLEMQTPIYKPVYCFVFMSVVCYLILNSTCKVRANVESM